MQLVLQDQKPVLCSDVDTLGTSSVISLLPPGRSLAPGNGGEDLSPFGPLCPQASSPTSVSPHAPVTLASSVLSEHSNHTHPNSLLYLQLSLGFYPSFKAWLKYHLCEAFPYHLLCSLLLPSSYVAGSSHCIAHLLKFPFLNRELPEATASSDPALNPQYST